MTPTPCRACGHIMHTYLQPALMPGREGMHYHTCKNAACFMAGQTLNERDYPTLDLNRYLPCKKVG